MYLTYDNTGKIVNYFQGPSFMWDVQPKDGGLFFIDVDDSMDITNMYVLSGNVMTRPTQATLLDKATLIANGIDVINITNAPDGIFTATNTSTGESVSGSISGNDTFLTTVKGTIKIKIEAFPYLDFTTTIEAI